MEHVSQILNSFKLLAPEGDICPNCKERIHYQYLDFLGERLIFRCRCEMEREKERVQKEKEAQKRQEILRRFANSGLGKRFECCSLENFLPHPGNEEAREKVQAFLESFPQERGLFLFGPPGNGKTHLAAALSVHLLEKGFGVVFVGMAELMYRFNATYRGEEKELELVESLTAIDLLVLDDFDKGKWSEKVEERMYVILNGRYREMKPTIITTNLNPRDFEKLVGKAIFNRLEETMEFVAVLSPSFRRGKSHESLPSL